MSESIVGVVVPATRASAPAVAPTNAGIVGKTVECHGVKYVVLAIQYDPQYGQWFALVQREDGSLDCASLHAARIV